MDVTFITTTAAKLNSIPIVDGQVIAISDESSYYYDMSNKRNRVSGTAFVSNLVGTGQENMLYVVSDPAGLYLYENGEYKSILPDAGIPDAPSDGKLYGRQDGEWAVVNIPDPGIPDAPNETTTGYIRYKQTWQALECDIYTSDITGQSIPIIFNDIFNRFWSLSYRKIKLNIIGNYVLRPTYGININLTNKDDIAIELDFSQANIIRDSLGVNRPRIVTVSGSKARDCSITISNLSISGSDVNIRKYGIQIIKSWVPITARIRDCNIKMEAEYQLVDIPANSNLFFEDCEIYPGSSSDPANTWLYKNSAQPIYTMINRCTLPRSGFKLVSGTRFENLKGIGNIVDYNINLNMPGIFDNSANIIMQNPDA